MRGKIVKGIGGFYYVHADDRKIYECKARGIFRKDGIKPLVGDNVELEILDAEAGTGNILRILPRNSSIIRPALANIDQAAVVFAVQHPDPNFNLLDRFLILMGEHHLPCVICFNKCDTIEEEEKEQLISAYEACGYQVLFISAREGEGMSPLLEYLAGKTTALAGPSGVGKSTLLNSLCPGAYMETGELSKKTERGKQTTRHSEIFAVGSMENTFLCDTPGFSSLDLSLDLEKEDLRYYYPEFAPYEEECRFPDCAHRKEPDCGVKNALKMGKISKLRYDNYQLLYEELMNRRKW